MERHMPQGLLARTKVLCETSRKTWRPRRLQQHCLICPACAAMGDVLSESHSQDNRHGQLHDCGGPWRPPALQLLSVSLPHLVIMSPRAALPPTR